MPSLMASRALFMSARAACLLAAALSLSGCASRQAAVWGAARSLIQPNRAVDTVALRPEFRYLRVTVEGKAILMVLGYEDRDAHGRPVQVWFSAGGDVLRTQGGRLVGVKGGGPVQWSAVRLPAELPPWLPASLPQRFVRTLDEMPGYHWQRMDQVELRPASAQTGTALKGLPASSLQWFEESATQPDGRPLLRPARYALAPDGKEPVYGEQCLNQSYCLSWQTWPPQAGAPPSKP